MQSCNPNAVLENLSNQSFNEIPSLLENDCLIYAAVQELLKRFEESYKHQEEVPDDVLSALNTIFGDTFEKALELVETDSVKLFYSASESVALFQVEGSLHRNYIIFPYINYCSCLAYKFLVAGGSNVTCKHILASIIAKIIGKVELVKITALQLHNILLTTSGVNMVMSKREMWPNRNQYIENMPFSQPEITPPCASTSNWVHIPPQTMPWGLPSASHPAVVRFTGGNTFHHQHAMKRKQDIDFEIPKKQLVTEEKMAAHMRNLHISDIESSNFEEPVIDFSSLSTEDDAMEGEHIPKLVVSDEIKNLKAEPIIPESILNTIERPKMAVVLWQPPGGDLGGKLREENKARDKAKEDENDILNDNNNVGNTYNTVNPIALPSIQQSQFFQPVTQFQGHFSFS